MYISVYVKYKLYTPHQIHASHLLKYLKILKSKKVFCALHSTSSYVPVKVPLILFVPKGVGAGIVKAYW